MNESFEIEKDKLLTILKRLKSNSPEQISKYDIKNESKYSYTGNNSLEKFESYKNSEDGFDADVALFSVIIYGIAFPYVLKDKIICRNIGAKYEIKFHHNKVQTAYHGDTMNSVRTIQNRIKGFDGADLADYLERYVAVVHTIGNLIPAPHYYNGRKSGGFNTGRYAATKDYWDLTLYCIYQWYSSANESVKSIYLHKLLGQNEGAHSACRTWLVQFKDWADFVQNNHMQDFVSYNDGIYGMPIEYWEDHFSNFDDENNIQPTTEQAKQFLVLATELIKKRGMRIAAIICGFLENMDEQAMQDYVNSLLI